MRNKISTNQIGILIANNKFACQERKLRKKVKN